MLTKKLCTFVGLATLLQMGSAAYAATEMAPEDAILSTVDIPRDFCPTDVKTTNWGPYIGVPGMACLLSPALPICVIAGGAAGIAYGIYDAFHIGPRIDAEKTAKKTCEGAAPANLDEVGQRLWTDVCETLTAKADADATIQDDPKNGTGSVAHAPYGLDDSITDWTFETKPGKRVNAFVDAQVTLRSKDFPSCLSDPKTLAAITGQTTITLRQGIDIMVENIRRYGTHAFQFTVLSGNIGQEKLREYATRYLQYRSTGEINEYDGARHWDNKDVWTSIRAMMRVLANEKKQKKDKTYKISYFIYELDGAAHRTLGTVEAPLLR